jgi:hypothetical protein
MTYVIAGPCIDAEGKACADECPAGCPAGQAACPAIR